MWKDDYRAWATTRLRVPDIRPPYLYIAVYGTGIASSQATLSFSMFRSESPFYILAGHVTSRTRPCRFSARNTEKLGGVDWAACIIEDSP